MARKRLRSNVIRRRRLRWLTGLGVVAALLAAGAVQRWSQEARATEPAPFVIPEQRLLTREEVEQSLGQRFRAMRQRYEQRKLLRRQRPPRDYSLPAPPPGVRVPPPPEAPDGEITLERLRGAR